MSGFYWRYMDASPHDATFETATEAIHHFLLRSGSRGGPSYAVVYKGDEWKDYRRGIPSERFFYEVGRLVRGKTATVYHCGEEFEFKIGDAIEEAS